MPLARRTALVVLLLAPVAARSQTAASPKAFLEQIYRPYLRQGYEGTRLDRPGDYFTPPLAQAIAHDHRTAEKNNEAPQLDGDPFIDAQDFELTDLAITVDVQGDKASAIVTFKNSGRPVRLLLALARTAAGWRIDDIRGGQLSLRALYKLN
jgi:hypothetical protein